MVAPTSRWAFSLIVSLFILWGIANSLNDILIKQFKKAFTLSDMQASLVQSAFYTGYFVGALPAAKLSRAYGYKISVMTGLALFSVGSLIFFPMSRHGGSYAGFLVCLYFIAFGLAFLESSANPWIVLLGDDGSPGSGTRALNLAQSFNPLGMIAGILIGRFFILDGHEPAGSELSRDYRAHEAGTVGVPYVFLGVVVALVAGAFGVTEFPATTKDSPEQRDLSFRKLCSSLVRLWRQATFAQGVLAQAAYVGGQVCVWSFVIRLVQEELPGTSEQNAADCVLLSQVIFVVGRFAASALLNYVHESTVLCAYALLASALCVVVAVAGGILGVLAMLATSFFMSMMFPTIFGMVVSQLDREDTEVGAAILVMSIIGGAVFTPIMGALSDGTSIAVAYLVPGVCFMVVMLFALQRSLYRPDPSEHKPLVESVEAGN